MCKYLHQDSTPIPKEGVGWKIFYGEGPLFSYTGISNPIYINLKRGYINWDDSFVGEGFCFFLSLEEAKKVEKILCYDGTKIKKIKYKQGLGKHYESEMLSQPWKPLIALCRKFKILEDE